jgi:predicted metalloprotease with PDZ domain
MSLAHPLTPAASHTARSSHPRHPMSFRRLALLVSSIAVCSGTVAGQALAPIIYTVSAPAPVTHIARVQARIPTGRRPTIELMMAVWSPGFYKVENYANRLDSLSARSVDGRVLAVDRVASNRWRVHTDGLPTVIVSYTLLCAQRSVTTNWIDDSLAVFNGPATFVTLADSARPPAEVHLELAPGWSASATSLLPSPDGNPNHYVAPDYDTLVDSPIIAGHLSIHTFAVDGIPHLLVDAGNVGSFDGARAAHDIEKFVRENRIFWGFLPYHKYVFLNVFRQGRGGLEHLNSTLLTTSADRLATPTAYFNWIAYVSHEYFHAYNVKRLRPVELGPFDYEHPPSTPSLWIAEGLTSYYGEMLATRGGDGTPADFLATLSGHIAAVQHSPGRLVETLSQSSLDVWGGGTSGVGRDQSRTIDYYEKGPVVGWLLDARIRHATADRRSLDDVMRLAYTRYSGAHGFTPAQFRQTADDVSGTKLEPLFHATLDSTEELSYQEALDWFGLRFGSSADTATAWRLEVRTDATDAQRQHFASWFAERGAN